MLTFTEAKRLSLLKWKYIYNNDGSDVGILEAIPELKKLHSKCGFCELYRNKLESKINCKNCPLILNELNCTDLKHPYAVWSCYKTKENAEIVLDLVFDAQDPDDTHFDDTHFDTKILPNKITAVPKTAEEITGIKGLFTFYTIEVGYLKEMNNIALKGERITFNKINKSYYDYESEFHFWKKEWLKDIQVMSQERDWSKVLLDVKVIIRNKNTGQIRKRHFASIDISKRPAYFANGGTSWSDTRIKLLNDNETMELYNNQ